MSLITNMLQLRWAILWLGTPGALCRWAHLPTDWPADGCTCRRAHLPTGSPAPADELTGPTCGWVHLPTSSPPDEPNCRRA